MKSAVKSLSDINIWWHETCNCDRYAKRDGILISIYVLCSLYMVSLFVTNRQTCPFWRGTGLARSPKKGQRLLKEVLKLLRHTRWTRKVPLCVVCQCDYVSYILDYCFFLVSFCLLIKSSHSLLGVAFRASTNNCFPFWRIFIVVSSTVSIYYEIVSYCTKFSSHPSFLYILRPRSHIDCFKLSQSLCRSMSSSHWAMNHSIKTTTSQFCGST